MEFRILGALLAWMLFQVTPLPPAVIAFFSPKSWELAKVARATAGYDLNAWLPLSIAPAATLQRLLNVIPAMAAFVAVREMGRWWNGRRLWILVAPVIAIALLESLLAWGQFYSVQASTEVRPVSGSYVNRNHFAGLLEMALPLSLAWAIAIWGKASKREHRPARIALLTANLLGIAAIILAGVIGSLSRMGFAASLAGIAIVAIGWLVARDRQAPVSRWLWLVPVLLPVVIVLFVSSNAMVLRFADGSETSGITADGRNLIWKETLRLITAYPWTGTGLGAYEQGLYPFRTVAPAMTVDFAHNDYLQALAELGLVGGAMALAFAIWILWKPLSLALRPGSKRLTLCAGLVGAFLAIGLHSFVDFNLYIPANALVLAWLAGIAVSPGLET